MILATHGIVGSQITQFVGLLDTYSGAAAAYSLRRLRTAYTGDAIRVRRASDNTEQDIGFVNNELDTSTLTSFCSGTNGFVKTWYDQSGNGNDATQNTAVAQPQIVSSGSTITENGNPTIDFDGSNYYLNINSMPSFIDVTMIVVLRNDTSIQDSVFIEYAFDNNNTFTMGFGNLSTQNRIGTRSRVGGVNTYIGADIDINTQQRLITFFPNSTTPANGLFYLDGTQYNDSIGARSVGTSALGSRGGGTYSFNGNIQEAIIYNSDESSNRTGIETNINDFYSIYP